MLKVIVMLFLILLFGCSQSDKIQWQETDGQIIIQLDKVNPDVAEYYAEITNEEGRRFSVNLGLPNERGAFKIPSLYGRVIKIKISSNIDNE